MTTLSVREYIMGIYRKLNLDESLVRKMQTGGPDGDLGSNEILLGKEKYTAIGLLKGLPLDVHNWLLTRIQWMDLVFSLIRAVWTEMNC